MNAVLLLAKLPDERIKGNSIVLNDKFKFTLDDVIQKPIVNADNTNIFLMHSEKDNKFCYDLFHDIFLQLLSNGQDCKYCVLGWKNDQTVYDFLGEKTLLKETNPTWNELDSLDLAKSVTSMYSADMSNPLAVCLDCSTTSWDSIKGQHEIRSSRLNVFVLKVEKDMNQVQKINNIIQNSHDDYTGLLYESDSTKFKNQIIGCIFDFENKFEDNLLVLETCNMLKSDLNQNAKPLNIELESSKEELNLLQSKIVLLESRLAEAVTLKEFEGDNYLKLELQHQIERNQQLETERDYMSTELTILRSGYLNSLKPSNASLHLKSSTESLDNSFTMAKLQRAASSSSIPWDQSGISFETEVTKDFMNHLNLELQLREMTRAAKYYKSKLVQLEAGSSREVLDDTEALKLELGNITVRSLQSQNKALRSILETKSLELVESEKRSLQIREESDSAKEVIKLKEFDLLKSQEKLKRAMNSLKILEESVISNEPTRDVNLASKIDFQSQLYHEMSAANQKLIEERDQLKIRNLYLEETQLTLSKALENYKMTVGELEGRVKETEDMKYLRTPTEFSDQISDVSVSRIPRLKRLSNNSFSLDRASISSMSNDGHMARRNSNASTDILSRADSSGLTEKLRSYADVSDKIKDSTFERGAINIPQYKVPAVEDGTLTKASFSRVKNRMLEENLLHDFIHQEFSKEREKLVEELISCKQYISEMETKLTVSQAAMGEQHGSLTRVLEQAKEDLTFIKEQLQQEKIHNSELSEQLTIERSRLAISQKDNITMKDTMSKQVEDLQNKKVVIEGLEVELENFKSKATILEDKLNQLNTIKITNESLKANLDACNLKLISTTQRRDELEKLVISSKKKQMATENQLITSGADLSNCKVEIKRLNELIQQTKSDSADVKERALIDDMTKLKASTEDLESRLKSANVKRLALEDEKLELQEIIKDLNDEKSQLNAEISSLNLSIQDIFGKNQNLQISMKESSDLFLSKVESLKSELVDLRTIHEATHKSLQEKSDQLEVTTKSLKENKEGLSGLIISHNETVEDLQSQISILTETLISSNNQVSDLKRDVMETHSAISDLQRVTEEMESHEMSGRLATLKLSERSMVERLKQITESHTLVKLSLDNTIIDLREQIDQLLNERQSMSDQILHNESTWNHQKESLEKVVDSQRAQIVVYENELISLKKSQELVLEELKKTKEIEIAESKRTQMQRLAEVEQTWKDEVYELKQRVVKLSTELDLVQTQHETEKNTMYSSHDNQMKELLKKEKLLLLESSSKITEIEEKYTLLQQSTESEIKSLTTAFEKSLNEGMKERNLALETYESLRESSSKAINTLNDTINDLRKENERLQAEVKLTQSEMPIALENDDGLQRGLPENPTIVSQQETNYRLEICSMQNDIQRLKSESLDMRNTLESSCLSLDRSVKADDLKALDITALSTTQSYLQQNVVLKLTETIRENMMLRQEIAHIENQFLQKQNESNTSNAAQTEPLNEDMLLAIWKSQSKLFNHNSTQTIDFSNAKVLDLLTDNEKSIVKDRVQAFESFSRSVDSNHVMPSRKFIRKHASKNSLKMFETLAKLENDRTRIEADPNLILEDFDQIKNNHESHQLVESSEEKAKVKNCEYIEEPGTAREIPTRSIMSSSEVPLILDTTSHQANPIPNVYNSPTSDSQGVQNSTTQPDPIMSNLINNHDYAKYEPSVGRTSETPISISSGKQGPVQVTVTTTEINPVTNGQEKDGVLNPYPHIQDHPTSRYHTRLLKYLDRFRSSILHHTDINHHEKYLLWLHKLEKLFCTLELKFLEQRDQLDLVKMQFEKLKERADYFGNDDLLRVYRYYIVHLALERDRLESKLKRTVTKPKLQSKYTKRFSNTLVKPPLRKAISTPNGLKEVHLFENLQKEKEKEKMHMLLKKKTEYDSRYIEELKKEIGYYLPFGNYATHFDKLRHHVEQQRAKITQLEANLEESQKTNARLTSLTKKIPSDNLATIPNVLTAGSFVLTPNEWNEVLPTLQYGGIVGKQDDRKMNRNNLDIVNEEGEKLEMEENCRVTSLDSVPPRKTQDTGFSKPQPLFSDSQEHRASMNIARPTVRQHTNVWSRLSPFRKAADGPLLRR